jgi:hypothetical protein
LPEGEWLFSWGWHALWHGPLSRERLDMLVGDRPTAIWQRSCHEWILNSAALDAIGLTCVLTQGFGLASEQLDWERGHFYENGFMIVLAKYLLPHFMTRERFHLGLKQLVEYIHQSLLIDEAIPFLEEQRYSGCSHLNEPSHFLPIVQNQQVHF